MKIINVKWSPKINYLIIRCNCSKVFAHRSDRFSVYCPHCKLIENLEILRDNWLKQQIRNNSMSMNETDLDKLYETTEASSAFLPLPDGVYIVKVEKVVYGKTKKSDLPMISWTFKVVQGEKEGRLIFKNEVLLDPANVDITKMRMGIVKGELKVCGITDSFKFADFNDTVAPKLANLVLKVFQKTTTKGDKSYPNVNIKEIYSGDLSEDPELF